MTAAADPDNQASDDRLMLRVQTGDPQAFAQLYTRHRAQALNVALAVCSNLHQAEDVVQEGFLSIWRGRSTYSAERGHSFRGWAMETVRNRAIDSLRRDAATKRPQVTRAEIHDVEDLSIASPLVDLVARSERDAGNDALKLSLDRLPDAQAEVISLAYFEQMTHTEIAAELSVPEGTVKGRIRLAMQKLRFGMRSSKRTASK